MDKPILFDKFPDLDTKIPWIGPLSHKTPVKKLKKIEDTLHINDLWVKCDNITNPHYGSNKPRKLEFLLADVIAHKKNTIVTIGGIGSNHHLSLAIFCQEKYNGVQDIKPIFIMFKQPVTEDVKKKLLIFYSCGVKRLGGEMIYTGELTAIAHLYLIQRLKKKRKDTCFMFAGGSDKIGTLGYVCGALELKDQVDNGELPEPDYIFVTVGSAGTMAGLDLGCKLAGLKSEVIGVRVTSKMAFFKNFFSASRAVRSLAKKTYKLLRKKSKSIPKIKFGKLPTILHNFYGEAYGKVTLEARNAIDLFYEKEDIILDGTYTGKTAAGMIDFIEKKKPKDKIILLWNTYNSVDITQYLDPAVKYTDLPKNLHQFFEK
ncbi:MAG: 1-aminocyclopropane-1-carboxylate deaminase/D-cysteine desulfhydrase [Candidatus Helarchaeota archaeon]